MKKTYWNEKCIGDYLVYFGLFSKGDLRVGLNIGNKEGHIDLLFFTVGYMK